MDDQKIVGPSRTLNVFGDQYQQHMDNFARDLTAAARRAQGQIADAFQALQPQLDSLSKVDWNRVHLRAKTSCERLANLGWALPMLFTPREMVELTKRGNTDQEIEKYMVDFFTFDDGRYLRSLRGQVLRSDTLFPWRGLLEQCFEAYEQRHYLIIIPALLSIIEGVVAQKANGFSSRNTKVTRFAAEIEKAQHADEVGALVWLSTRLVLEGLFANSDFTGPRPVTLNRHWVLHGRDQTEWCQIDVLRLFNLLATIG